MMTQGQENQEGKEEEEEDDGDENEEEEEEEDAAKQVEEDADGKQTRFRVCGCEGKAPSAAAAGAERVEGYEDDVDASKEGDT